MSRTTHRTSSSSVSWLLAGAIATSGLMGGSVAFARTTGSADRAPSHVTPLPHAQTVATVVVDNPQGQAPAAPAAPATVVQPTPVVQSAPVVEEPSKRQVVHAEVGESHNYMSTVALSALMGGVAGGLVGGAIYFIDGSQPARNVAYWAAGGVLVGTAVGVTQVLVQESRTSNALSLAPTDPVPTYRLALWHTKF